MSSSNGSGGTSGGSGGSQPTTCRNLTLPELIAFYVAVSLILAVIGSAIKGGAGAMVGLLLGAVGSTVLYFTMGNKMIGQPIPFLCPKA